jgi:hypothetical protein
MFNKRTKDDEKEEIIYNKNKAENQKSKDMQTTLRHQTETTHVWWVH